MCLCKIVLGVAVVGIIATAVVLAVVAIRHALRKDHEEQMEHINDMFDKDKRED